MPKRVGRNHEFGSLRNCTLLYVEDDDATAYLFQTALRESGIVLDLFRVVDGNAALSFLWRTGAFAHAPRPDLIVLDLNLPGKSGFDILQELRRDASLQDVTVVIFSSSNRPEDRQHALEAGADAYFTKEPDLNAFIETVQEICRRVPTGPVLKFA